MTDYERSDWCVKDILPIFARFTSNSCGMEGTNESASRWLQSVSYLVHFEGKSLSGRASRLGRAAFWARAVTHLDSRLLGHLAKWHDRLAGWGAYPNRFYFNNLRPFRRASLPNCQLCQRSAVRSRLPPSVRDVAQPQARPFPNGAALLPPKIGRREDRFILAARERHRQGTGIELS